jgi:hypothetical protein
VLGTSRWSKEITARLGHREVYMPCICTVNMHTYTAGHRSQDQCRRHRYSSTQHLSPVLYQFFHRTIQMQYSHLKAFYEGGEGYPTTSILLVVKRYTPACSHCLRWRWIHPACPEWWWCRWIHPAHPYSKGGKDTPSRPHCCWCKGKDPHVHTVGSKMDTVTPSHPPLLNVERVGIKTSRPQCCCIHPLVYIVDYGKGYTFTSTPADSAKGYTLMSALTIHPHVHTVECGNTSSRPYCW